MDEGGNVMVTVANYDPCKESDILAFVRSEGYSRFVDDDAITAECDGCVLFPVLQFHYYLDFLGRGINGKQVLLSVCTREYDPTDDGGGSGSEGL